jgi:DNA-binding NtrC family response regulator
VLTSWIGHTDLLAMAVGLDLPTRHRVQEALKRSSLRAEPPGPIQTLIEREKFDEVHLLSNDPEWLAELFLSQVAHGAILHRCELNDPTDYCQVFAAADRTLAAITQSHEKTGIDLQIHLSPGTPAMAATWVLLGKSRYPATFFQTHRGRVQVTEIPFDLTVDFLPQLLRDADRTLQHLAALSPREVLGFEHIVGDSRVIRLAVGRAQKAALRDVPVLVVGESGTGKELFAQAIHAASPRRNGRFVALNCAAIPKELLESELFGHIKGAFTGAGAARAGAFEEANGGTLFLDEVGECDPAMQAKLLRVLQPPPGQGPCHRVYRRVGEIRTRDCDVRVIAATNRDLVREIDAGRFREDLYYRLGVITVKLPPLRDRKTDIPHIANALLVQVNQGFEAQEPGYKHKYFSVGTMTFLQRHSWPGNVRQLYNAILQAAVMAESDEIGPGDMGAAIIDVPGSRAETSWDVSLGDGFSLEEHLKVIQRQFLQRAMVEAKGVKKRAAALLGYENYQTLDAQLKRLNVTLPRFDRGG